MRVTTQLARRSAKEKRLGMFVKMVASPRNDGRTMPEGGSGTLAEGSSSGPSVIGGGWSDGPELGGGSAAGLVAGVVAARSWVRDWGIVARRWGSRRSIAEIACDRPGEQCGTGMSSMRMARRMASADSRLNGPCPWAAQ